MLVSSKRACPLSREGQGDFVPEGRLQGRRVSLGGKGKKSVAGFSLCAMEAARFCCPREEVADSFRLVGFAGLSPAASVILLQCLIKCLVV